MKTLIIAEKPAAGKDIARILNVTEQNHGYYESDKYIVTWAVGHLIKLKDPDDNDERFKKWTIEDIPLPWDNGLKVIPSARDQFKVIKDLIKRKDIDCLINAGDAGREGLLIQNWIYEMAGNRLPVKILWTSSLTDQAIKDAMNHLHDSDEKEFIDLFREAETRAIADQVYGYNYTRLLTILYRPPGQKGVLSFGRCQTPLLNLIYQRDLEIENFVSKPYWTIEAAFDEGFSGILIAEDGKSQKFGIETEASNLIKELSGKAARIKECIKEHKKEKAPALLNLPELQNIMGKKYGMEPTRTLEIAQKLYETHKILSYPRTDSRFLSSDLYHEIGDHLKSCDFGKFKDCVEKIDLSSHLQDKSYYNDNKVSDHHALIPTIKEDIEKIYEKLSEEEKNCFDEVAVSFISMFYPPYEYDSTKLLVEVSGGNCLFSASGTSITKLGYKEVTAILKSTESKIQKDTIVLPELSKGQVVQVRELSIKEDKTKPKPRFGPGNIVKLMQKYRIGTPATTANIVQTLLERKFIELKNKNYVSTELGRQLIQIIPEELKSAEFTILFERNLKKVNSGEINKEEFLNGIIKEIEENKEHFQKSGLSLSIQSQSIGLCPLCNRELQPGNSNWYCPNYKEKDGCNFKLWRKVSGKKIPDTELKKLLDTGKSGLIKGFLSKNNKEFSAYLVLDKEGKLSFEFPKMKKR